MQARWKDLAIENYYQNRPPKPAKALEIFYDFLHKNRRFKRLKGYTEQYTSMASNGGYYFKYRKYNSRCINADWYCYRREDGLKALVCLPQIMDITTYAKLQILWVPPEDSGKGIATAVIEELQEITGKVDDMAKAGEKYKGKNLDTSHFSLTLCPNSFVLLEDHWNLEDIYNGDDVIDWTESPEVTEEQEVSPYKSLRDETWEYIPKDKRRLDLHQLRKFYINKMGFVECSELGFHSYYDWENGRVVREFILSPRSFTHQRWPLIWPPENKEHHDRKEEEETDSPEAS